MTYGDDWDAEWRKGPVGAQASPGPWGFDIIRTLETYYDHLPTDSSPSYLAIGCGRAGAEYHLQSLYDITLTDISPTLINRLDEQAWAQCRVEDAQQLSFADNTFDVSVSEGLLEHYFDDSIIQRIVSEMARVTKHFVFIVVPYSKSPAYMACKRSPRWLWGKESDFETLAPYFEASGLQLIEEFDIGGEALSASYGGSGRPYPYLMSIGRKV